MSNTVAVSRRKIFFLFKARPKAKGTKVPYDRKICAVTGGFPDADWRGSRDRGSAFLNVMDPFLYYGEVSRDVFDSGVGVAGHYEVYPFESSLNHGGAVGSGLGMSLDSSVHRAEMNHNAMVVNAMEQYGMRGTEMVGEDVPLYSPFSAVHGHRYQQHYGEVVGQDSVPMRQERMGYAVHSRQTRLQEQHLQHEPQQARPARATETRLPQGITTAILPRWKITSNIMIIRDTICFNRDN